MDLLGGNFSILSMIKLLLGDFLSLSLSIQYFISLGDVCYAGLTLVEFHLLPFI